MSESTQMHGGVIPHRQGGCSTALWNTSSSDLELWTSLNSSKNDLDVFVASGVPSHFYPTFLDSCDGEKVSPPLTTVYAYAVVQFALCD